MAASFEALDVPPRILDALATMGYQAPTPVQEQGLPPLLDGRDVILEAQTGSGKTAAYGIPSVVVGSRGAGLRALVLVPTRELARQVAEEVRALGAGSPFRAVAVTGGVQAEREERTIAGDVRCIVATPGRLLALLEQKRVRLDRVQLVVLDEADRMLDMGFRPDIEKVLAAVAAAATGPVQKALVSATLPKAVVELAAAHLREPLEVRAGGAPLPQGLTHFRLNVFPDRKERALVALLRAEAPERAIVFVRTRERAAKLAKLLKKLGIAADPLQGDMSHDQRRHVFDLFARGVTKVLVATDIASRGLDVPEMELVVNYDLPEERGAYTHRAGRAARLNRPGRVVSLVEPDEKAQRVELERESGSEWAPYRLDPATIDAVELPEDKPAPPPRRGGRPPPARAAPPARKAPKKEEKVREPRARPDPPADVPASRKGRARKR